MQWGDEGKGKIVDLLCPAFDVVVRYQGGDNAGHTVKFGERHFALHLVPSGILHATTRCVLASGMVINPEHLFEELDKLQGEGVDYEGRLFISKRAHVLLPFYPALDQAREAAAGKGQIGTTARGIGPAYENKVARRGLRMGDLLADDLEARIEAQWQRIEREIAALGGAPPPTAAAVTEQCRAWGERLQPLLHDTEAQLNDWIDGGQHVLFEGAQGVLLDIDHGTYPYVTSSNPVAGGVCTGAGVPPTKISGVVGILKAYTTRVGGGPFITELTDQTGEFLRSRGNEFGTTTGRPRRCGWLDLVAAGHSRMISGVDTVALTKLDVLDELEEIKICVGYHVGGDILTGFPSDLRLIEQADTVCHTLPGWQQSTVGILDFDDLPTQARDYIAVIEEELGAPVGVVSTGPRRAETIIRPEPKLQELTGGRLETIREQMTAT
jgi:adenylosuccinate synthase